MHIPRLRQHGYTLLEKPVRDLLQKWRRCLASLLFFTIILTDNFGLTLCQGHYVSADTVLSSPVSKFANNHQCQLKPFELANPSVQKAFEDILKSMKVNYTSNVSGVGDNMFSEHRCRTSTPPRPECEWHMGTERCELWNVTRIYSPNKNYLTNQCLLYLEGSHKNCICGASTSSKRLDRLRMYYLRHCYHYNLWHVLNQTLLEEKFLQNAECCHSYLSALEELDLTAHRIICWFEDILARYDCGQDYSVQFSCENCMVMATRRANRRKIGGRPFMPYIHQTVWPIVVKL